MRQKRFITEVIFSHSFPYEESLVDGKVNRNHLMYLACVEAQKKALDPTKAHYRHYVEEFDHDDPKFPYTKTELK